MTSTSGSGFARTGSVGRSLRPSYRQALAADPGRLRLVIAGLSPTLLWLPLSPRGLRLARRVAQRSTPADRIGMETKNLVSDRTYAPGERFPKVRVLKRLRRATTEPGPNQTDGHHARNLDRDEHRGGRD